jgi:hypothetical protein
MSKQHPFEHPLTKAEERKIEAHRKTIGRGVPFRIAHQALGEGAEVIPLAVSGSPNSVDRVQVYFFHNPDWYWIDGSGYLVVMWRRPRRGPIGGWVEEIIWEDTGGDVESKIIEAGLADKIAAASRKYGFRWRRSEEEENPVSVYTGIIGFTDPEGEYHHLGSLKPKYGESKAAIQQRLYDKFWDARLDSAGASPSYYIEESEPDEGGDISLSFGVMPTWREFAESFRAACPSGTYNITTGHGGEPGLQLAMDQAGVQGNMRGYRDSHDFTAREMFDVLNILKEDWGTDTDEEPDDTAGAYLASSIMGTIGYEWV